MPVYVVFRVTVNQPILLFRYDDVLHGVIDMKDEVANVHLNTDLAFILLPLNGRGELVTLSRH